MVRTIFPSLPMRMKALGVKPGAPAASASPFANGKRRLSNNPPPAAAPACRKARRETPRADDERAEPAAKDREVIDAHGQPPCPLDCAACLIASRMRR